MTQFGAIVNALPRWVVGQFGISSNAIQTDILKHHKGKLFELGIWNLVNKNVLDVLNHLRHLPNHWHFVYYYLAWLGVEEL